MLPFNLVNHPLIRGCVGSKHTMPLIPRHAMMPCHATHLVHSSCLQVLGLLQLPVQPLHFSLQLLHLRKVRERRQCRIKGVQQHQSCIMREGM